MKKSPATSNQQVDRRSISRHGCDLQDFCWSCKVRQSALSMWHSTEVCRDSAVWAASVATSGWLKQKGSCPCPGHMNHIMIRVAPAYGPPFWAPYSIHRKIIYLYLYLYYHSIFPLHLSDSGLLTNGKCNVINDTEHWVQRWSFS